jgi:hypothetical protein
MTLSRLIFGRFFCAMNIAVGLIDCKIDTPYPTFHATNTVKGKNKLLKELSNFDYGFMIHDGIKVKDPLMFEHYAITAEKTGHQAFTSGTSEVSNNKPVYDRDPYVDYWLYPGTMLLMLTKKAMWEAGKFDEKFPVDTYEDFEYLYRLCRKGMIPPFGLWIGIKNEGFYFDIDPAVFKKRMERTDKIKKEIEEAVLYWQSKDPENFPYQGKERVIGEKKIELKKAEGMI